MARLAINLNSSNREQGKSAKGPVKLIKRVKIAHSFLRSVSDQFHVIVLSLLNARSKFWGLAGSEDFAHATLPTTPLDFQGKI